MFNRKKLAAAETEIKFRGHLIDAREARVTDHLKETSRLYEKIAELSRDNEFLRGRLSAPDEVHGLDYIREEIDEVVSRIHSLELRFAAPVDPIAPETWAIVRTYLEDIEVEDVMRVLDRPEISPEEFIDIYNAIQEVWARA